MASTLDTLEIAKRLKDAGFSDNQAEVLTGVLREASEVDLSGLATKSDLTLLRQDLEILRRDLTIRTGGMIAIATGILLAAKFFG